jgi:hypothetical protein
MHKNIVGNLWNDTIVAKCLLKVLDFVIINMGLGFLC